MKAQAITAIIAVFFALAANAVPTNQPALVKRDTCKSIRKQYKAADCKSYDSFNCANNCAQLFSEYVRYRAISVDIYK
jgi:hypothetical protein